MSAFDQALQQALDEQQSESAVASQSFQSSFQRSLESLESVLAGMPTWRAGLAPRVRWADELGVALPCDVADVMRAFRRLAFKTHPDRPGGSHDAFLHTRALLDEALAWMHAGPEVRPPTTWVSRFRGSTPHSSLQSVYA